MAASVRIDGEAFSDPRIELLGIIAGYNRFEALGRLAHLWMVCTHRFSYTISEAQAIACLGEKGVEALIKSDLGVVEGDAIRVKGTQGRIEWLNNRREAGKRGGKANVSKSADVLQANASKPEAEAKQNEASSSSSSSFSSSSSTSSSDGLIGDQPTKPTKKFSPPTVDEVAAYCLERGNRIDAQRFVDHYTSKGWKIGKTAMKDWRAAVRTWEGNDFQSGAAKTSPVQETADSLSKLIAKHGES